MSKIGKVVVMVGKNISEHVPAKSCCSFGQQWREEEA